MLRFMKGSYKEADLRKLTNILYEGSKTALDCNLECDQCPDAKVCKDVSELIEYLSNLLKLLPEAKNPQ